MVWWDEVDFSFSAKNQYIYSLNLDQSKSTDYQWNLTDLNSLKEVTTNQSNFTDYFSGDQLI